MFFNDVWNGDEFLLRIYNFKLISTVKFSKIYYTLKLIIIPKTCFSFIFVRNREEMAISILENHLVCICEVVNKCCASFLFRFHYGFYIVSGWCRWAGSTKLVSPSGNISSWVFVKLWYSESYCIELYSGFEVPKFVFQKNYVKRKNRSGRRM